MAEPVHPNATRGERGRLTAANHQPVITQIKADMCSALYGCACRGKTDYMLGTTKLTKAHGQPKLSLCLQLCSENGKGGGGEIGFGAVC